MRKSIVLLAVCLLAGSLAAQKTHTLKRFKRLSKEPVNNSMLVTMGVSSAKVVSAPDTIVFKTIFDLTGRGQEAVLTNKTNDQMLEILNKKFLAEAEEKVEVIDLTSRKISVVFSIDRKVDYTKKGFNAYDRIEDLRYNFRLDNQLSQPGTVKFTKWNKYSTEYGTLDVGALEYNQSFSANLNVAGKLASSVSSSDSDKIGDRTSARSSSFGPELSATATTGYANSTKENQLIKERYIQLTGFFAEDSFGIHQQGTRETELAGNVSIDLTIQFPKSERLAYAFIGLYDNAGMLNSPDKVVMRTTRYYIPSTSLLSKGITGTLNYQYVVRHIKRWKKARTYVEYDDKIVFIQGNNTGAITLIKPEELMVPMYYMTIKKKDPSDLSKDKVFTLKYVDTLIDEKEQIDFMDFQKALEFETWLLRQMKQSGGKDIFISGKKITFVDATDPKTEMSITEITTILKSNPEAIQIKKGY